MQVGVLIFMTIALALSAQAATFSNASLKGSYSFLTNLWTANSDTNEFAMVGIMTFDGAGNVTGSYTSTDGGVVQTGTLGGTYTVNSNGTGTIDFANGSTAQFAITLDSTAAKVAHGVQLLQTNDSNNEVVSGTAVLQSTTTETYSVASIKGTFSSQWNLWMADASATEAGVDGMISFDGKGNWEAPQTTVFGGGVVQNYTSTGTYIVNPDGSVSSSSTNGSQSVCVLNSVVAGVAKGAQCLMIVLNGHSLGNIAMTGTALSAQATKFSNASLKGSYSFLTNLWTANSDTNEFAMVGIMTFDGAGNVTGSYTSISLGVFQTGTLGGTYTVNSNGTGTITFTSGSTAQFAIALDLTAAKVAHGVELLQTNDPNNEIVSGTAVLQSTTTETYSVASLKGNFSFQWNLWMADASQAQVSDIGMVSFDGKGNCKDSQTIVIDGVLKTKTETGTYTVNPDGSGSTSWPDSHNSFVLNSVAAGQAKGAQFITNLSDSGNYVITGTTLKQ
jgi:hypothetical protein